LISLDGFEHLPNMMTQRRRQMKFEKTSCCAFIIGLVATILIAPLCHAGTSSDKTSIEEVKQETQDLIQTLKA
jgi:hypothetical protein